MTKKNTIQHLVLITCISWSQFTLANNGEFITSEHKWFSQSQSVVPIYYDAEAYEADFKETAPEKPQPICTGTLTENAQALLSAAHCFQKLCESKKDKDPKDYFFVFENQKVFLKKINLHPEYCYLAFDMDYKEKLTPNPFMPELSKDIALAKIPEETQVVLRNRVPFFPNLHFSDYTPEQETFYTIGFGVSDRMILQNTLWLDVDKDNVHDSWDLCADTKVELIPKQKKLDPKQLYTTNGCSSKQTPPETPIAIDYYASNKVLHKRGFSFQHLSENDFIFDQYRISSAPYLVNHGYRGSFPYMGLQAMSFGGDSGSAVFIDSNFSQIVAITNLFSGVREFAIDKVLNGKERLTTDERRVLMSGGFNVFLKIQEHEGFLKSSIEEFSL